MSSYIYPFGINSYSVYSIDSIHPLSENWYGVAPRTMMYFYFVRQLRKIWIHDKKNYKTWVTVTRLWAQVITGTSCFFKTIEPELQTVHDFNPKTAKGTGETDVTQWITAIWQLVWASWQHWLSRFYLLFIDSSLVFVCWSVQEWWMTLV